MELMDKTMDKTAPTLELRDIHLPDDPSIWPLAFGWWILIRQYLANTRVTTSWVPSHGKYETTWAPDKVAFGTAEHWRALNGAADTAATHALNTLRTDLDVPRITRDIDRHAHWAGLHLRRLHASCRDYIASHTAQMKTDVSHFLIDGASSRSQRAGGR